MSDIDKTPVDGKIWDMRPGGVRVRPSSKPGPETEIPETGQNQRVLEDILETITGVLNESRDIKEAAQKSCAVALLAFDRLPVLEKRMLRVELVAAACGGLSIVTTIINAIVLIHGAR